MKNGMDKEDRLVSRIMKDYRMENPPEGFTERVMQTIQVKSAPTATVFRPLIGTVGWISIAVGILLLILYALLGSDASIASQDSGIMQRLPSFSLPSIDITFNGLYRRLFVDSQALTWIFAGIGGIILMVLVERTLNGLRNRLFLPSLEQPLTGE